MIFRREDRDDQTFLHIGGELDALTAPELRAIVDQIVDERCKSVVVDLSDLDMIDSSGVAVIVALFKRTRGHGGKLVVQGAKDQPLAVFKLLRMDRVFLKTRSSKATAT